MDISGKLKNESRDDITNYIKTRVKAYLDLSKDVATSFTTVIDLGFGRSVVNRALLKRV